MPSVLTENRETPKGAIIQRWIELCEVKGVDRNTYQVQVNVLGGEEGSIENRSNVGSL